MKVIIKKTHVTVHHADSHTHLILSVSNQETIMSCTQFLEYIKKYTPPLEMDNEPDCDFAFRTRNWLSRVVCNRYFFKQFTANDILRVLKHAMSAYTIDLNAPDSFGSPLILYAIQSGYPDVVEYLLNHGAKMTVNGVHVNNKVYKYQRIDINSCLFFASETFKSYIYKKVYREIAPKYI